MLYNGASLINLNVNTVGFYQISKILVTPTVMLINFAMYSESTTSDVKAAVGIMLVGVTMATVRGPRRHASAPLHQLLLSWVVLAELPYPFFGSKSVPSEVRAGELASWRNLAPDTRAF